MAANRAMNFFENRDHFSMQEFEEEVLRRDPAMMARFRKHRERFEEEQGHTLADDFGITPKELDLVKRERLYKDLQRAVQMDGPFTIMFQKSEQVASQKNVRNFVSGANFDLVFYRTVTKLCRKMRPRSLQP